MTMSDKDRADAFGQATREKLNQFVARIERLEAEKSELAADITEVYAEIKTFGLDGSIVRKVVSQRKIDADKRAEQGALFEMYWDALDN